MKKASPNSVRNTRPPQPSRPRVEGLEWLPKLNSFAAQGEG